MNIKTNYVVMATGWEWNDSGYDFDLNNKPQAVYNNYKEALEFAREENKRVIQEYNLHGMEIYHLFWPGEDGMEKIIPDFEFKLYNNKLTDSEIEVALANMRPMYYVVEVKQ